MPADDLPPTTTNAEDRGRRVVEALERLRVALEQTRLQLDERLAVLASEPDLRGVVDDPPDGTAGKTASGDDAGR